MCEFSILNGKYQTINGKIALCNKNKATMACLTPARLFEMFVH